MYNILLGMVGIGMNFGFFPAAPDTSLFSHWNCKFWVAWIESLVISKSIMRGSRDGKDVVAASGTTINSGLVESSLPCDEVAVWF